MITVRSEDFVAALIRVGVVDPTTKNVSIQAETGNNVSLQYDTIEDGVSYTVVRGMNDGDARGLGDLTADELLSTD